MSLETSKDIELFNKNSESFKKINKSLITSWALIIKQTAKAYASK